MQHIDSSSTLPTPLLLHSAVLHLLQAYDELTAKLRELDALNGISGLLGWDELVSSSSSSGRGLRAAEAAAVQQCSSSAGSSAGSSTGSSISGGSSGSSGSSSGNVRQ
jgi:hypothetical protein